MKRILTATAVAAALAAGNAQAAGQATSGFNVTINLTSACTVTAPTDVVFAYTSLQAGASSATGGAFSVSCTTSLPYTLALQAGTTPPFNSVATTIPSITDNVVQLTYSLGLSGTSGVGSGVAQNFNVTGNMNGNQAGTCASATCDNLTSTNRRQTLIVNY
jgi:spore coat protein U domain-containing protein, fimbrial subunit CupE1/2/3/6